MPDDFAPKIHYNSRNAVLHYSGGHGAENGLRSCSLFFHHSAFSGAGAENRGYYGSF